jgi:hypothetical protein
LFLEKNLNYTRFRINEVLGNLVTIYPNPNNGVFTIELNATTQVTITTILGDVLVNTTLNTGK